MSAAAAEPALHCCWAVRKMDKKEINSPKLTEHFVLWAVLLALVFLGLMAHLRLEGLLAGLPT